MKCIGLEDMANDRYQIHAIKFVIFRYNFGNI